MTPDEIIDGILARESAGVPPYLATGDAGGRTSWGISERAHPELWQPGPPTQAQARVVYFRAYVVPFDWMAALRIDDRVRAQAIDFGVTSGVAAAVRGLQRAAGLPDDGVVGPVTTLAVARQPQRLLNNALVAERIRYEEAAIAASPADRAFEHGWLTRFLSFYWSA